MTVLAAVGAYDALDLIFALVACLSVAGAAVKATQRDLVATGLLLVVAVFALVLTGSL